MYSRAELEALLSLCQAPQSVPAVGRGLPRVLLRRRALTQRPRPGRRRGSTWWCWTPFRSATAPAGPASARW
ncbi:MAG: hypothetical protein WKG07_48060 [Hymenobacter sp.]